MFQPATLRSLLATALLAVAGTPLHAQRGGSPDPAMERATAMYRAKASANDVAEELDGRFRVGDDRTVEILNAVGYGPPAIARAAGEVLRADARTTAALMAKVRMDAVAIASGLSDGMRVTGIRALEAMDAAGVAGVDGANVLRATRADADDIAVFLGGRGTDVRTTAGSIRSVHRLSDDALAAPLIKAYEPVQVAAYLKDDLRFDGDKIRVALVDAGVPLATTNNTLSNIGLAPPPPGNLRWWIRDYGYHAGPDDRIENAQIVDRSAVLQGAGGTDGVVWIEGDNLNHPDVEVWAGTTGGSPVKAEIRSRQSLGSTDRLEVLFPSMPAAGFRVVTPGGEAEVGGQAWPVGYAAIERELFDTALEGLDISLDHGDGVRIEFGNQVLTGDLDENRENGIETRVTDVNSEGFTIASESEPGGAALVVTIPFEENGREFEGSFFGYIPCWTCGTFEIPRANCNAVTLNCVVDFLGQGVASLGSCVNPENWSEQEILDLDGIDFTGDLTNTSLAVRLAMHVDGAGLGSSGTTFEFQTNVSIATNGDDVSVSVVDDYVRTRVVDRLTEGMGEIDLATQLIAALNQYAQLMGWNSYLSMEPMPDGRLFVSFPG